MKSKKKRTTYKKNVSGFYKQAHDRFHRKGGRKARFKEPSFKKPRKNNA